MGCRRIIFDSNDFSGFNDGMNKIWDNINCGVCYGNLYFGCMMVCLLMLYSVNGRIFDISMFRSLRMRSKKVWGILYRFLGIGEGDVSFEFVVLCMNSIKIIDEVIILNGV